MSEKRQSFDDTIQEYQRRDPFVPFNLVLASGDRYLIDDPFMMVNGPAEIFYAVPHSGRILRLRKNQIVAIEQLEHRPAA
jgi:hypothetical protein